VQFTYDDSIRAEFPELVTGVLRIDVEAEEYAFRRINGIEHPLVARNAAARESGHRILIPSDFC
jgi:hypothetical protein